MSAPKPNSKVRLLHQHPATTLNAFLETPLAGSKALLSDLDGCLISGSVVLPGAARLVAEHKARLWIVSNNSEDTARSLTARLAALGMSVPPGRIFLAGEQTLRTIARQAPGARIALFANARIRRLAHRLGLCLDRESPELAVLARAPGFTFADLARLIALAHRGVPVWRTNPDTSHPAADGTPVPETGALWAALEAAVAVQPKGDVGKPAPTLIEAALAAAGVAAKDAVFLGDTPATDGAAATAAGVLFVEIRQPAARAAAHGNRPAAGGVAC